MERQLVSNVLLSPVKVKKALWNAPTFQGIAKPKDAPNLFPHLDVLDAIVKKVHASNNVPDLSKVVFIGTQHMLNTTGSLFEALIRLGANPAHMFFTGKCYSSDSSVLERLRKKGVYVLSGKIPDLLGEFTHAHNEDVKKLWIHAEECMARKNIDQVIILDDGASAIDHVPPHLLKSRKTIVGVEQTRRGVYSENVRAALLPIINVAQSAAKQLIEPYFIQESALMALELCIKKIDKKNMIVGVAGLGAIGKALAKQLLRENYTVCMFDEDQNILNESLAMVGDTIKASSVENLIASCDYIFGCTGKDITEDIDLLHMNGRDRVFISLSSGDIEFNRLLKELQFKSRIIPDPLQTIHAIAYTENKIEIVNGGFPVNFDRTIQSDPAEKMAMTRALLLCGVLQALKHVEIYPDVKGNFMLESAAQRYIVNNWLNTFQYKTLYPDLPFISFNDLEWIESRSLGKNLSTQILS